MDTIHPQKQTHVPEGYTPEEWLRMTEASKALETGYSEIPLAKRGPPKKGGCQLYRHYDDNNQLLYIGISLHLMSRIAAHKSCAEWFNDISVIKVDHCPDKASAEKAEKDAIIKEKPKFNRQFLDNKPSPFPTIIGGVVMW